MVAADRCRAPIRAAFRLALSALVSTAPVSGAVAATFTANYGATDVVDDNPGDGVCTTSVVGKCSLRAAIMEANAYPGEDRINLANITYNLTRPGTDDTALNGDLDILESVFFAGTGPASTRFVVEEGLQDRLLDVFECTGNAPPPCAAGADIVVEIFGVGLSNGTVMGSGGGILNHGTLILRNVVVADSYAISGGGGAVYSAGPLTILDSTIRDNTIAGVGGIGGGGVAVNEATATIVGSTITGNFAGFGGGVSLLNATASLVNTTISGNDSLFEGGGMRVVGGNGRLFNVTVADNRANSGGSTNSFATGGGVFNIGGSVTFHNSIISANDRLSSDGTLIPIPDDCAGTFTSNGYNLVTAVIPQQCTINGTISTGGAQLEPLQNNGGPTLTHAIVFNATAWNAGNPAGCVDELGATLETDQRGQPRPFGPACDMGAYERGDYVFRDGFE